MVAELLGYPQLTFANKVTGGRRHGVDQRQTEAGYDEVQAAARPSSAWSRRSTSPRYPNFRGSWPPRRSRSTPSRLPTLALSADEVGAGATTAVVEFADAPPRAAGQVVTDDGSGGVKIADYLSTQKFI